jgi:hypothetical protein
MRKASGNPDSLLQAGLVDVVSPHPGAVLAVVNSSEQNTGDGAC